MDYKYIEQLLEQYWQGNTSLEEEQILRTFFCQKEVPASLMPYRALFVYQQEEQQQHLGEEFDAKILAQIDEQPMRVVRAQRIPLSHRFRPFYKAAAAVAILITVGTAASRSPLFNQQEEEMGDEEFATIQETYTDPDRAYSDLSDALMTVSDRIQKFQSQQVNDSTAEATIELPEE
jgi:hypothetical protein